MFDSQESQAYRQVFYMASSYYPYPSLSTQPISKHLLHYFVQFHKLKFTTFQGAILANSFVFVKPVANFCHFRRIRRFRQIRHICCFRPGPSSQLICIRHTLGQIFAKFAIFAKFTAFATFAAFDGTLLTNSFAFVKPFGKF